MLLGEQSIVLQRQRIQTHIVHQRQDTRLPRVYVENIKRARRERTFEGNAESALHFHIKSILAVNVNENAR